MVFFEIDLCLGVINIQRDSPSLSAISAVSLFRSQSSILSPLSSSATIPFSGCTYLFGRERTAAISWRGREGGDLNGKFRYRAHSPFPSLPPSSASTTPPRVLRHSLYTYAREFIPGEPVISARAKARPWDILGISEPSFAAVTPGRFEGNFSFMASDHRWRTYALPTLPISVRNEHTRAIETTHLRKCSSSWWTFEHLQISTARTCSNPGKASVYLSHDIPQFHVHTFTYSTDQFNSQ